MVEFNGVVDVGRAADSNGSKKAIGDAAGYSIGPHEVGFDIGRGRSRRRSPTMPKCRRERTDKPCARVDPANASMRIATMWVHDMSGWWLRTWQRVRELLGMIARMGLELLGLGPALFVSVARASAAARN